MADREQPVYLSDRIDPVWRSRSEELFLLTIEARPTLEADDYGQAGGAFVNCWIDADDLRTAERKAVALILQQGWQPYRFDSWEIVTRDTYASRKPSHYDGIDLPKVVAQAFSDGAASVFNIWPVDAPDADGNA